MKVVFDLVYLHCGPTAPFLKEHPEFTWWNPDGTVKKGPWRFPKLNFAVPGLRAYFMDNIKSLIRDFGADGFRCDVGDGIPLDFWCDAHDMMDDLTGGNAVLLCEGFTVCDQYKGFDADYGWFPGMSAKAVWGGWTGRERQCPVGSRFVNHYENHDIATDARPRREKAWGHDAIDQVLVWMFTLDGVPLLFTGNEIADADERHSMFGKTPMDWSQLAREPGKSRHAFVKRLAALRREHPAFTDVNGSDGLTWLDTTAEDAVTAFVRRNGSETILVVQNWTRKPVKCTVSFAVSKRATASYLAPDETDRVYLGKGIPTWTYGLTVNMNWKNFDLSIFGTGVAGNNIYPTAFRVDRPSCNTYSYYWNNSWDNPNVDKANAKFPAAKYWSSEAFSSNLNVFSGAYFKIKQIQLGYTLPRAITQKIAISNLRVYAMLDNFITFTNYFGLDPETATTGGNSLGFDMGNYPTAKSVIFGVNLEF